VIPVFKWRWWAGCGLVGFVDRPQVVAAAQFPSAWRIPDTPRRAMLIAANTALPPPAVAGLIVTVTASGQVTVPASGS
jgi:hypothetical protein